MPRAINMRIFLTLLFCILTSGLPGASFSNDFAVVFIDAATEAKLGKFPLDRALIAKAVLKAGEQQAKGVVLKFFLDQPRNEASDRALAGALTNLPVLLQARIDDSEAQPNPLPERFTLPKIKGPTATVGVSGWLPLPMFSANAKDVGFADVFSEETLLKTYQAKTVKSVTLSCIEMATGSPMVITTNGQMKFGAKVLPVDSRYMAPAKWPVKDNLAYIPFHQFVAGEVAASQIKGKIVIIGYDGPQMHTIPTSMGQVRAHRLFVYNLQSIYGQLEGK